MSEPNPTGSTSKPKTKTFKPRAGIVRKSQAERDAHAKQEAEKAAVRAAAAAQVAGKPSQSTRNAASKKRDNFRDTRDSSQGVGGGVFGASTGTRQGSKRSTFDTGQSEMLEGQEGVKPSDGPSLQGQENFSAGDKPKGKGKGGSGSGNKSSKQTQEEIIHESDDESEGSRRDIERIWISSDEDQDDQASITRKGKASISNERKKPRHGGGLRPVRLPRTQIAERHDEVKNDKRTNKSSQAVVGDGEQRNDSNEMEIDDETTVEGSHVRQSVPSSPEISRRGKPGRKISARAKESKLATETVEEKAERLRLQEDMEKLREEFVVLPEVKQDEDSIADKDGSTSNRKLFLFQFPPLIPFLVDPTQDTGEKQQTHESGPTIKIDPDDPQASSTAAQDEPASASSQPATQIDGILTANESVRLPAGRVGKLRVHKSGKVTLDWGGTNMEVRYGTEVDFLQDAVLVETPRQVDEGEEKDSTTRNGTAYALGQVEKKMIVIPDWQKLYD